MQQHTCNHLMYWNTCMVAQGSEIHKIILKIEGISVVIVIIDTDKLGLSAGGYKVVFQL